MSILYITEPDLKISLSGKQIHVVHNTGQEEIIPIEIVESLVLIGNANLTTGMQRELLRRGIGSIFLDSRGQYFGRLESTQYQNISRLRCQFRMGEDEEKTKKLAVEIISAKIHNQIVVLRRYNRKSKNAEVNSQIGLLYAMERKAETAETRKQLLGFEGVAARGYFTALAQLVSSNFAPKGRSRRPPKDPFNSLLSFGYTLLLYEVYASLTVRGLQPYAGILHQDHNGHPALASDLMEEWRAVIVDSLVLSLFNREQFEETDFETGENGGVFLNREASKRFIYAFEKKIRTQADYFREGKKISFKEAIATQCLKLAQAVDAMQPEQYQAIRIR